MRESQIRFIRQLGFPAAAASQGLYTALMFQPRAIGGLVAIGVFSQSAGVFLALSAVLVWSTLVPTRNPFDAFYSRFVARPRGLPSFGVAPAPRLFAQAVAAAATFATGAALVLGATKAAWVLEALMAMSLVAVLFKDFCGPACLYHRVRGRLSSEYSLATSAGRVC
jgi:uncharacterized protein DUF4395